MIVGRLTKKKLYNSSVKRTRMHVHIILKIQTCLFTIAMHATKNKKNINDSNNNIKIELMQTLN